jgi:Na+/glutamate symporter
VLGNVLGGGTLGTIAGGVGGALVGRQLDKNHDRAQNRKNGC